jgi:hypothetical protein
MEHPAEDRDFIPPPALHGRLSDKPMADGQSVFAVFGSGDESQDVLARPAIAMPGPCVHQLPRPRQCFATPIGLFRLIADDGASAYLQARGGKFVSLPAQLRNELLKPCAGKSELIRRSSISNAMFDNGGFGLPPGDQGPLSVTRSFSRQGTAGVSPSGPAYRRSDRQKPRQNARADIVTNTPARSQ